MTEREWVVSSEPSAMLAVVQKPENARKLRLFAVAVYRQHRRWLKEEYSGDQARGASAQAVRVAIRAADGQASEAKRETAGETLSDELDLCWSGFLEGDVPWEGSPVFTRAVLQSWAVPDLAEATTSNTPAERALEVMDTLAWRIGVQEQVLDGAVRGENESPIDFHNRLAATESAQSHQREFAPKLCALFRELFGSPFRTVQVGPLRPSPEVRRLALASYEMDRFDELPVLADALEEAGCANPELLTHLRSPEPHARGCWALDAVLDSTAAAGEWAPSRPCRKRRKSAE